MAPRLTGNTTTSATFELSQIAELSGFVSPPTVYAHFATVKILVGGLLSRGWGRDLGAKATAST